METLFAFICSSNNNITRISSMVEKLCNTYGHKLGHYKGKDYYSFPPLEALAAEGVEQTLHSLGFGYQAGYIHKTAKLLVNERPKGWLESLRDLPYTEAHSALLELTGVGAKVADCVCLMGLDKLEAVPVDTHVWQIAVRDYGFKSIFKGKTLTNKAYKQVGDHFRQVFGPYAGWAHSILFSAELKKFQHLTKQQQLLPAKRTVNTDYDDDVDCKIQKVIE